MDRPFVKIAYIGGGSRYWARDLMKDLALQAPFDGKIALYDIDHPAALKNVEIGNQLFQHKEAVSHFTVSAMEKIESALADADFVILSIEPGPMSCRYADLVIPTKYGILQPVGDTTGPGGLLRALRAIPLFRQFARHIMDSCPNAWVINYTNPMTLCTRALYAETPSIKAFGCCHEVFAAQQVLLDLWLTDNPMAKATRRDVLIDVNGVNHFTWITKATLKDEDLLAKFKNKSADAGTYFDATEKSLKRIAEEDWFSGEYLVSHDMTRRFGAMAAAGNRHLVEFVPWYSGSEETLHRWGVICTPFEYRMQKSAKADASVDSYKQNKLNPTGEEGVLQMAALLGLGQLKSNVNLPNTGQSGALPADAVVETNATFSKNSLIPTPARALPSGANALVQRIALNQELSLQASLQNNLDLAFQALLNDPLVHIETDIAYRMFSEMIDDIRPFLPDAFQ